MDEFFLAVAIDVGKHHACDADCENVVRIREETDSCHKADLHVEPPGDPNIGGRVRKMKGALRELGIINFSESRTTTLVKGVWQDFILAIVGGGCSLSHGAKVVSGQVAAHK
jgi:hypothetical protein